MKVSINPGQFLKCFHVAACLIPRYGPSPVLETVRLEVSEGGAARLWARSLNAQLSLAVPVIKVLTPGACQLPAQEVERFLKKARCGVLVVERGGQKKHPAAGPGTLSEEIAIRVGDDTRAFPTCDPADFEIKAMAAVRNPVSLRAWRLSRLIRQTLFAADVDAPRYALGGCHILQAGGRLNVVATDGHRLAHAFEEVPGPTPPKPRRLSKRPPSCVYSVQALGPLLEALDLFTNEMVSVGITTSGELQVTAQGLSLWATPLAGCFPDWESVAATSTTTVAEVQDALTVGRTLGRKGSHKVKDAALSLAVRGRYLEMNCPDEGIETRTVVRSLLAEDGAEATVRIHLDDLVDYLAVVRPPFSIALPAEQGQPILFESEGFRYLVMPEDLASRVGPPTAVNDSQSEPVQKPPLAEAQVVDDCVPVEVSEHGTSAGKAPSGRGPRGRRQRQTDKGDSAPEHPGQHLG